MAKKKKAAKRTAKAKPRSSRTAVAVARTNPSPSKKKRGKPAKKKTKRRRRRANPTVKWADAAMTVVKGAVGGAVGYGIDYGTAQTELKPYAKAATTAGAGAATALLVAKLGQPDVAAGLVGAATGFALARAKDAMDLEDLGKDDKGKEGTGTASDAVFGEASGAPWAPPGYARHESGAVLQFRQEAGAVGMAYGRGASSLPAHRLPLDRSLRHDAGASRFVEVPPGVGKYGPRPVAKIQASTRRQAEWSRSSPATGASADLIHTSNRGR